MDEPNSAPRDDSDAAASEGAAAGGPGSEQTPSGHSPAQSGRDETAGPPDADSRSTDEIFAEMVAGLQDVPAPDDTDPGSEAPQDAPSRHEPGPEGAGTGPGSAAGPWAFPVAPWVQAGPRDHVVSPESAELEELEDRFIPPEPTSVLGRDPLVNLAWGVVVFVPLATIAALLFWPNAPVFVLQVAGLGFLASFGALLWRMPATRNPDQDDPGAVL